MTDTRAVIDQLAEGFQPIDCDRFRLLGRDRVAERSADNDDGSVAPVEHSPDERGLSRAAIDLLADAIYAEVHCALPASLRGHDRAGSSFVDGREYLALLSHANTGTGSWQPGWRVTRVLDDAVAAVRWDVEFQIGAGEWRAPEGPVRNGDLISVRIPKEHRWLIPGFYFATGDADDHLDDAPLVRVYWHVGARGAIDLVRALTSRLNAAATPFHLKTNSDPRNFGRTDSLVLYIRRERYADTIPLLAVATRDAGHDLDPRVSPFGKRLAPGVSAAEDPGAGRSFGEHRARLVAEALGSAGSLQAPSASDRARIVRDHIAAQGLDPAALYLSPGSTDQYPAFAP